MLTPEILTTYGVRTAWAILVVVASVLVARAMRGTTMRALQRGRAQSNAIILVGNLAQIGVLILGFLVVLAIYTGEAFGAILTSFSIVGLVVGLSLQDILKNFFAGIYILIERPFRIGDTIEVGGEMGVVEHIAFRTTLLRTADARQVIIPNSSLMTGSVTNHSAYPLVRASFWIALPDQDVPEDLVATVREALREAKLAAPDPAPALELRSASSGKAHFQVSFWAADRMSAIPEAMAVVRARLPKAEVRDT